MGITQSDTLLHIYTEGGGFGYFGGPNIWLDNVVWNQVDQRVMDTFGKK